MMASTNNDLLRLITAERDKLNNMIEQLQAGYDLRPMETIEIPLVFPPASKPESIPSSAKVRQHMREAQLRRYANKRAQSKLSTPVTSSTYKTGPGFRGGRHWTQTPEGRKRMAVISRKGNSAFRAMRAAAK